MGIFRRNYSYSTIRQKVRMLIRFMRYKSIYTGDYLRAKARALVFYAKELDEIERQEALKKEKKIKKTSKV